MDHDKLHQKLMDTARATQPNDQVPYAFEQRVMADIRSQGQLDAASAWVSPLWRSAIACVLVALFSSAWAFLPLNAQSTTLDDDLEATVIASFPQDAAW